MRKELVGPSRRFSNYDVHGCRSSTAPLKPKPGLSGPPAEHDDAARKRLIELLEKNVTREADVRRIKPLIATLKNGTAGNGSGKKAPPPPTQNKAAAATAGR